MSPKNVDLVVVDDNIGFIKIIVNYALADKQIDTYEDPHEFLSHITQYPKHTKIALDYGYKTEEINGVQLAEQLHEQGYLHLYLISNDNDVHEQKGLPAYLKPVDKVNIASILS